MPLIQAIYWYVTSIKNNVDSGLILSQTALELLSWNYCVVDRKMVSSQAFKRGGLSAADKMRLLATTLGLPKIIPSELTSLTNVAKKYEDSMDAITKIRNSLVHPDIKSELKEFSYYEVWQLSLWYIELAILKMCSHNGKYANRLAKGRWVGKTENVPWQIE